MRNSNPQIHPPSNNPRVRGRCTAHRFAGPRHIHPLFASLALTLALAACGGGGQDDTGTNVLNTLARASAEPAGSNCPSGGVRIDGGLDGNVDGVLQGSEVTGTQYVCHGAGGASATGLSTLVRMSAEPLGANCPTGGTLISAGLDAGANGVLDISEVSSTAYVCGGVVDAKAAAGVDRLITLTTEVAGVSCTYGGQRVAVGLDQNRNGALDATEITRTGHTCNGLPGSTGPTGPQGPVGPGITWDVVTTAQTQAVSNTGYVASTSGEALITLPSAPAVGALIQVTGAGTGGWRLATQAGQSIVTRALPAQYRNPGQFVTARGPSHSWNSIASSDDGTKLVASDNAAYLYTSTDSGETWTQRGPTQYWRAVASSADGTRLVASSNPGGGIHTSSDSGLNWTVRSSVWATSVASSADGRVLLAAEPNVGLHRSTDYGVTWTVVLSGANIFSRIAVSPDGTKFAVPLSGGQIALSSDSGATWTHHGPSASWYAVSMSADGSKLAAVWGTGNSLAGGELHTSHDGGATWTLRLNGRDLRAVAMSHDGQTVVAGGNQTSLLTSSDGGVTWAESQNSGVRFWNAVAMSRNGQKAYAGDYGGQLYTTYNERSSMGAGGGIGGSQYDSLTLQYLGNGVYAPLNYSSFSGNFTVY